MNYRRNRVAKSGDDQLVGEAVEDIWKGPD